MGKQDDTMAILKLYELRRNKQMRRARQWYFTEFAPTSAMDIVALFQGGERASSKFRMVASYWDTACSLVLNEGIDRKMFLDANTEHVFIYAKIADFLPEVRQMFRDPDFLIHLETLVRAMPDFESKMESRKRLIGLWTMGDGKKGKKRHGAQEKETERDSDAEKPTRRRGDAEK